MDLTTKFKLGDKVTLSGDTSVIMNVIGAAWYSTGLEIYCGWFASGVYQRIWFYEWQLEKYE